MCGAAAAATRGVHAGMYVATRVAQAILELISLQCGHLYINYSQYVEISVTIMH